MVDDCTFDFLHAEMVDYFVRQAQVMSESLDAEVGEDGSTSSVCATLAQEKLKQMGVHVNTLFTSFKIKFSHLPLFHPNDRSVSGWLNIIRKTVPYLRSPLI